MEFISMGKESLKMKMIILNQELILVQNTENLQFINESIQPHYKNNQVKKP